MKWPEFNKFDIAKRTFLLGYMGSQSHGTWIPPRDGGIDDKDVMGVCVPPKEYFYGMQQFEQLDAWAEEYDVVVYDVRKYFRLLLKSNPNVLGLLWLNRAGYIKTTPGANKLIKHRDMFSSKKLYKAFTGYAYSQLKKMQPRHYCGYMGAKRKALVEQFGYDTKNAAHLIRLLRMGIEFLVTGELNVLRPDAKQLMAIKKGEYTLSKIQSMADDLFDDARRALIHSTIKAEPDYAGAEKLLMEIVEESWKDESLQ